ncbi:glycosyltransferase [Capillimicrobium parvum]|uniref:glycosyltransferase n=1 Tax=Capillimicrobium parvum TaxID=2884022 RepID=UPI00216B64BB|nr:glycosyltransferase [Capillimicrobium parvum]
MRTVRPSVVVEIGSQFGELTRRLLEIAEEVDAVIHSIDPEPGFDVEGWEAEFGDRFVFHRGLSLNVLPDIADVDLLLIDGDHNHFTVLSELRASEERAARDRRSPPVIALHDVDWPYGRRDMYYAPDRIPEHRRHPYAHKGLRPGTAEMFEVGINDHLANAIEEGGPRNGVRTAIEDFIATSDPEWVFRDIPGAHGLGILAPETTVAEDGRLGDLLELTGGSEWLRERAGAIELMRLWGIVARRETAHQLELTQQGLAEAQERMRTGGGDPADRQLLDDLLKEVKRLRRSLDKERERTATAPAAGAGPDPALAEQIAQLGRQLGAARETRSSDDPEIVDELRDLAAVEAARATDAMAKATEAATRAGAFERELESMRADYARLAAGVDTREAELATATQALEELEQRLSDEQAARTAAEARVAELEEQASRATVDAGAAASQRRRAEQDLADVRETLERELDEQRAALEAVRAGAADAEQRRLEDRSLAEQAARTAEAAEARVAELRAALDEQARERTRLETELGAARGDLEGAAAERAAQQAEIESLTTELGEARIAHERRAMELEYAQTSARDAEQARERAERELQDGERRRSDELADTRSRAQAAEEAAARARDDLDQATQRVLALERQLGSGPPAIADPAGSAIATGEPATSPSDNGHVVPGAEHGLDPASPEFEPRRAFLSQYLGTVRWTRRPVEGVDPLALPQAADRRHVLVDRADQVLISPSIDVVVCVHNALEDVRVCLWSLVAKSDRPFRLILVNDGSDAATTAYLESVAETNPKVTLIHNAEPPHGYTIAANLGMREATADYVAVLNSDTIVTFGWLQRLVDTGDSNGAIGILGPLSNAASHQSVPRLREGGSWATNPLPPWLTADGMASIVAHVSPRDRPRLPFVNGFCYVVKRAVFDAIGYFDEEHFASGYSEENDFSYRALKAGFELAVADDAYVFHAKSKSFTVEGRNVHAKRNYQIFLDKHGREEIETLVKGMEANTALAPLRAAVEDAAATPVGTAAALMHGDTDPLAVVFVLPGLGDGGSGGSHSIYQEVRGLRQLGVNAHIALPERAFTRAQAVYDDAAEVFQTFRDEDDLVDKTAGADVISATHFKSVAMVQRVRQAREDFLPAYYIQDYEPFFASKNPEDVAEAVESYTAIEDMLLFAKTHWLCNVVGEVHGLHVAKVEPSIDEQLYVPPLRPRDPDGPVRVVGMVRPRTPRRQPFGTVKALERLQDAFPDTVEVMTFGCHDAELAKITESAAIRARHLGLLTRHRVASLLARSDVFLDLSMYQAFGRTALEAMACGCTAVAPRLGGVWEFARDGENMVAVDTLDEAAALDALTALVDDRQRLRHLQTNARETASRYSILRAAISEYVVFEQEHARRFGRTFRRADQPSR